MDPKRPTLDDLIRGVAPRAPRGIADGVEARLRARRRARRTIVGVGVAAGLFVAAAAALVLWLVATPTPHAPPSAWRVTAARAATVKERALAPGEPLAVGAVVHVAAGGEARLERATATATASVTLAANTDARVGDGALELLSGGARLEGPEARLTGDVAEVTTLATGGAATVELRRENAMSKAKTAALAALLTVSVHDGGARVEAKDHTPVLLAKNDKTMVAPRLPPLTTRAPVKTAVKTTPVTTAKKPAPASAKPAAAATTDDDAKPKAEAAGELDKDTIRTGIRATLGGIKDCYEAALIDDPHLGGRFVVRFTIETKDGKGRISEGEIEPSDGDLDAPKMQQCILQAISQAEFPPSADGEPVVVSYPFVLKAGE
jgi:hypothetical protein